ncbi:MAG: AMP-binding protein, partial [Deltaproteobacteria bacterium]|nr:AMP-binding protein [Deltaproteobacteria bacterium]
MTHLLEGFTPYKKEDTEMYIKRRWWTGMTLGDMLDRAADVHPNREAFVDGTTRLTFSRARDLTNRLAIGLNGLGIKPQDRVLLQLPNWNEFVYAYFSLQKIGAVPVLLIDRYRQYEIKHLFRLTGATSWIVPEKYRKTDYLPIINDVLKETPQLKNIILARDKVDHPFLSLKKLIEGADHSEEQLLRLTDMRPDPMQVAHMGPTGGTTGLPKVAPRTHNDILCNIEYSAYAWDMAGSDIQLLAGPIGHDLTFNKGLCAGIFTFGKCVFLNSTDTADICRTIDQEKVTAVAWVPTLARRLVNFDGLGGYDLSSLKKMYCGGGASLPDLINAVVDKLGCTYHNAYGGTEGQHAMTRADDDLDLVLASVGKPTCPYDSYKVVDRNGNKLPPDTQGELLIKGPGVFTGYYKAPEENEKAFDPDGYFRTGDVARMDASGNITLTG